MSDPGRPGEPEPGDEPSRPQYGEYATPDEQRARIRQPDASRALETGQSPGDVAPVAPRPGLSPEIVASGAKRGPLVDRVVTGVLLVLGLFNVVLSAPGLFVFDEQLQAVLDVFGVEQQIADPAGARMWGTMAGVVMIVGYLLTTLFTWWWVRRGRIAFWIPIVGAVVTTIAMSLCINVPLMSDPAFAEFTDRLLGVSIGG